MLTATQCSEKYIDSYLELREILVCVYDVFLKCWEVSHVIELLHDTNPSDAKLEPLTDVISSFYSFFRNSKGGSSCTLTK